MARTLEEEGSQVFNNGGSGDGVSKKWKERPRDENWKPYQCPHSSCFKAYTNSRHCAVHPHLTCVKGGLKAPKGEAREQDGTTNPATTIAASFVGSERAGAPAVVVAPLPSLSMAVVDDLSHRKLPPLSSLTPLARLLRRIGIYGEGIGWQAKSKILISFLQVECSLCRSRSAHACTHTHAHARILLTQVITVAPRNFVVKMPAEYTEWMAAFNWIANLDFVGLAVPPRCLGSYEDGLLVRGVLPLCRGRRPRRHVSLRFAGARLRAYHSAAAGSQQRSRVSLGCRGEFSLDGTPLPCGTWKRS